MVLGGQGAKDTHRTTKTVDTAGKGRQAKADKARSGTSVGRDRRILFGGKGKEKLIYHNVVYEGASTTGQGGSTTEGQQESVDGLMSRTLGSLCEGGAPSPQQLSGDAMGTADRLSASLSKTLLCEGVAISPPQLRGDATGTAGKLTASLAKNISTSTLMVGTLSHGGVTTGPRVETLERGDATATAGKLNASLAKLSHGGVTTGPRVDILERGDATATAGKLNASLAKNMSTGTLTSGILSHGGVTTGPRVETLAPAPRVPPPVIPSRYPTQNYLGGKTGESDPGTPPEPPVTIHNKMATSTLPKDGRESIDEALKASQALKSRRRQVRCANKRKRVALQEQQGDEISYWTRHQATSTIKPMGREYPTDMQGQMCPAGNALSHPAANLLRNYATQGCPSNTGANWTVDQLDAAVERGPHQSALEPEARDQHKNEVMEKVARGQARIVDWADLRKNLPRNLKISPIAMVPHSSRKWRAILDLSFMLKFDMGSVPSVNSTSAELAPRSALDQLGHVLPRIIAAMAQADQDTPLFLAKWDIKDGFWRLMTERGSEYNFAYVLPQEEGKPPRIVIPTPLQMGWTESPPFFCAAAETARDVAQSYAQTEVGSLPAHKFDGFTKTATEYQALPDNATSTEALLYLIEVFVDDFIGMCVPRSKLELDHVSRAIQHGIHDIFPPDANDEEDPTSLKKLRKGDGAWALRKDVLGWTFDGENKTVELQEDRVRDLRKGLKDMLRSRTAIPLNTFQKVAGKLQHASMGVPGGKGLFTPINKQLGKEAKWINLTRNSPLRTALTDWRALLLEANKEPTKALELVHGEPAYIGIVDASKGGVGGVVFGHLEECKPTVFRFEWPAEIQAKVQTQENPSGTITNSDLEMAGLLLVWLVMEAVVPSLRHKHVALLSDNSPSVSWVTRLASKSSMIAGALLRALALRLRVNRTSPLTPLHIRGVHNRIGDIPSRSFGYKKEWHFPCEKSFLTFFNSTFPLPNQDSWHIFQLQPKICTRVTSVLLTKHSEAAEWRKLPSLGKSSGGTGKATAGLWEWILTLTREQQSLGSGSEHLQASQQEPEQDIMAGGNKSPWGPSVRRSRPLARRLRWTQAPTL